MGSYVECRSSAVEHTYEMWQAYLFRVYVSYVKCMYSSTVVTLLIVGSSYEVYIYIYIYIYILAKFSYICM